MKRAKFISYLNEHQCIFVKHGARHDKFKNILNNRCTYVPRHAEIDSILCSMICRQLDIEKPTES
jgi:hypothetical protein